MKPVTTQGQNSIDVYLPGKDEVTLTYLTRISRCKCNLHVNFLIQSGVKNISYSD